MATNSYGSAVGWTIAGVFTLGGMSYVGYRVIRKNQENAVQKSSSTMGSASNFARRLKMAFDNDGWPGTNNDEVFATFNAIPSKLLYSQVQKVYPLLDSGRSLDEALQSEMSSRERNSLDLILSRKKAK